MKEVREFIAREHIRVARNELPWVNVAGRLPTPTGLCPLSPHGQATTPLGLPNSYTSEPRVARSSQPGAGGHNPFGIGLPCRSLSQHNRSKIGITGRGPDAGGNQEFAAFEIGAGGGIEPLAVRQARPQQ